MKNKYLLNGFIGKNSWWRYLVIVVVVFAATQIGSIPFGIIAYAKAVGAGIEATTNNLTNFELLGIDSNLGLFLMLIPFTFGLIAFFLLVKPIHEKTFLQTLTTQKRFNWNKFFFAVLIWGLILVIEFVIGYISDPSELTLQFEPKKFIGLVFVAVIFLGLQSSFEEILFRGYFQQGLANLTKNAWMPLLITSALFALMHIMNPEVEEYGVGIMLPQYLILGLLLGITVIMDDGLELAIGVHVVNNVLGALLLTNENSVLKTYAIFKTEVVDPKGSLYVLLVASALFLFIMHKKYKWGSFKKLLKKVKP